MSGGIQALSTITNLRLLDLSDNQLDGQIQALSALAGLETLNLSDNQFGGPIPALNAHTSLESLDLSNNQLDGQIPDLSTLTSLESLDLTGNNICLPEGTSLSHPNSAVAEHLQSLNLPSCLDTETPTTPITTTDRAELVSLYNSTDGANWTNITNWLSDEPLSTWHGVTTDGSGRVTALRFENNGLSGLLPDLGALTELTVLYFGFNQLTGPIPDLSALTNLTSLSVDFNEMSGQFPDLSALSNLTTLSLPGNRLTGTIPNLSALTNLTVLYLGDNQLTGPVPDLSALTALTDLDLIGNQLCLPDGASLSHPNSTVAAHLLTLDPPSCTPAGPEQRAALVALYNATDGANWTLDANWLSEEPIGSWDGVYTNHYGHVTRLSLHRNWLSGAITDLSTLTNLTSLDLSSNQLSGQIPDLSALAKLTYLDLNSNQLSEAIPDFSALTKLTNLDLSSNQLSGQIPALSTLTDLQVLDFDDNILTGPFPGLSDLTKLWWLQLSNNQLNGEIPDLSTLTRLSTLLLQSNQFRGSIRDMSALTGLAVLKLGDNQLSGEIMGLSALFNLVRLDLSSNQFSGEIPDLSALKSLESLHLNDNQLTGKIPELGALTFLETLDLSDNQLSEQVPDLSALTKLTSLYLDSNQLTGQLPVLSSLTNLTSLYLHDNLLIGPVLDLNLLTRLTLLFLNNNQLTGPFPDLSALTSLRNLDLRGNLLCLPSGSDLAGSNSVVTTHLNSLNLAACTDAELAALPGVPQNLAAAVDNNQVTLTWDGATNAASYELRAWDSFDLTWGPVGGVLTNTTTYTNTVQTDGRNYYYQVRARNANDVHGAGSASLYLAVVTTQFPPPPLSLGYEMYYQKYMNVGGIAVVAQSVVSDEQMIRSREVITGMLANRSDLHQDMAANSVQIFIRENGGGYFSAASLYVPVVDPHCDTFIRGLAYLIDFAIDRQTEGPAFNSRLRALYQAASRNGLWPDLSASTDAEEYWAETVKYWLWEYMPPSLAASYPTVADHDPEIVNLIEETLGEATIPSACKP